jgi:AraC-like DNA-binding protein
LAKGYTVAFNSEVLTLPIVRAKPELRRMAESYIENIIGRRSMDAACQVYALIERLLGGPTCTLKQIAAHIRVHERTQQSKLKAEGLSSSILVDRLHHQRSKKYLAQKNADLPHR